MLPDGTRNGIRLMRLKDKLGNRSNASAEIEYEGAVGWRLGAEGRGVATIIEMVSMTRLDCVLGSASLIRAALSEAAHHVAHRSAFGAALAQQPLMQTVIADLALESEAATALALRLAGAVDRDERAFLRLALPAAKYLVCKRAPAVVAEALECLGGNGFVEDSGLPRRYREAPLNSIWEGSGNVTALDVLRAITREPDAVAAVLAELDAAAGADQWFDRAVRELRAELRSREPRRARRMAELLALCLQGSLLLRHAPGRGRGRVRGLPLPARRAVAHRGHAARSRPPPSPSSPASPLGRDAGARRPPLAELVERLVAERVHARPGGQRVRDGDVQALDPVGHPARADVGAERRDGVAFGEVRLVRAPVGRRQLRVFGEPGRHLLHPALGLQACRCARPAGSR